MATWKKVIVSGSNAHLIAVTASVHVEQPGAIGFWGTASWAASASVAISSSFALTASYALNASTPTLVTSASFVQIHDRTSTAGIHYLTFVDTISGYPSQSADTNLTYVPSTDTLTLGNIAVNSGSITTTSGSFNIAITNATAIQIGGTSATVTIPGNLAVNGTTTFVNTENVLIKDKFILLNSGSATGDGGIIIQETADFSGSAFYWADTDTRWALQRGTAATATAGPASPNSYIVSVSGSSTPGVVPGGNPLYGGTSGYGNMFINTFDETIWIYV